VLTLPGGLAVDRWLAIDGDWALVLLADQPAGVSRLARWNVQTGEWSTMDYFNGNTLAFLPAVSAGGVAFGGRPGYLVRNGKVYELPFPPGIAATGRLAQVAAISDDGTMAAGILQPSQLSPDRQLAPNPVLWTCA
jgi:hypothetical protein